MTLQPRLTVTVPGPPVGAQRPRVVRLKNGHSHTFMPDKAVRWEEHARQIARAAWGDRPPLDAPVHLELVAVLDRPKALVPKRHGGALSRPGEERLRAELGDPEGRLPAQTKPDIDNVAKLAMDALVKAAVLRDDTRVVDLRCRKVYAAIGEPAGVFLRVYVFEREG